MAAPAYVREAFEREGCCPLDTDQLVDLILGFVDLYNSSSKPVIQLYSYQRLFMRRIIGSLLLHDGDVITGLWSRQSGKSESISCLAGALSIFFPVLARHFPRDARLSDFAGGFYVGVFAPRLTQSGYIYERVRTRAEKQESVEIYVDPEINIRLTVSRGDQVSWSHGSFVRSQTASEQSNVEGATYHLIILDECQLISRTKVSKEIMPMAAATNGTVVKIGTAHIFRGGFHDSITHNIDKERQGGSRNHFEFPYEVVIAEKRKKWEETGNPFHLKYEAWVAGELERLGGNTDNEEFKMNFRLLWQETTLGAVDREAFTYDCPDNRIEAGEVRLYRRQVAGLDLARSIDNTVLTILELGDIIEYPGIKALVRPGEVMPTFMESLVVGWKMPEPGLWREQLREIIAYLSFFAVDTIAVDSTGQGDPIAEQLGDMLPGVLVIPVNFNVVSKDHIYKHYLQEISTGRFRYAAGPKTRETLEFQMFVKQHEDLEKVYHGRYLSPSAPEGGKEDYCDSAALAVYASTVERVDMSDVECIPNPFYANRAGSQHSTQRADRYRSRR